jgi:hypothetical protein
MVQINALQGYYCFEDRNNMEVLFTGEMEGLSQSLLSIVR